MELHMAYSWSLYVYDHIYEYELYNINVPSIYKHYDNLYI